jgi:pyruvate dehydrogenase E1 component alpha subunit
VDGNDVLAVHAVTRAALDRARAGEGPTFIEAFTYRMGAHTTSDDPTRYRIAAEVEEWKLKDPIARVKAHLARGGLADETFFAAVEAESDTLAAHVRQACLSMPDPTPEQMFEHVYRDPHPLVEEERAWFEQYHAGFADGAAPEAVGQGAAR